MSSSSQSLESLVQQLQSLVNAGNVDDGKKVLSLVKIAILSASSSPGCETLAATALELGVLLSVADNDLTALSRHMALLLPYYAAMAATDGGVVPPSPKKAHVLGLHLMHLLVEHRLAEFHSLLEIVTEREASSPFIAFPVGLERQLMVGMYDEVLSATTTAVLPDASYQFFVHQLQQTVRDSIADGMEVAYTSLSVQDAATMMKFDSVEDLLTFIQDYRDDWIIENGDRLAFQPINTTLQASDINAPEWIQQSLQYATEMERIV